MTATTDRLQAGCYACEHDPDRAAVGESERIWVGPRWRVAHAVGSALPGWLVLLPRRHLLGAHELTAEEAGDLGDLIRRGSQALVTVTGCVKTYLALFAEAEGFAHLHVHLVPRAADADPQFTGPRVFGLLGRSEGDSFTGVARDALARRLRAELDRDPG